ncbi:unnamed protein product [Soboliphyme baturini]|uniref:Rho-GAP domain-containing protein n=1 Tax=Soboliphyme baturini TaxID=241478 RepID=A0A183IP59_9BILA|nr:unnamed protein product [Soboliphyme baturini]
MSALRELTRTIILTKAKMNLMTNLPLLKSIIIPMLTHDGGGMGNDCSARYRVQEAEMDFLRRIAYLTRLGVIEGSSDGRRWTWRTRRTTRSDVVDNCDPFLDSPTRRDAWRLLVRRQRCGDEERIGDGSTHLA